MRLLTFIAVIFILASCSNTWEGIKEDSREVGQAIGDAAETVGKKIKEATE